MKPRGVSPAPDKFISRLGDSAERFIVIEIVKFAFILGVKPGEEFLGQVFAVSRAAVS